MCLRCAAAVIDRVICCCGAVMRFAWARQAIDGSACGMGGYCHFVGVGVRWRQCYVDRGGCVMGVDRQRVWSC